MAHLSTVAGIISSCHFSSRLIKIIAAFIAIIDSVVSARLIAASLWLAGAAGWRRGGGVLEGTAGVGWIGGTEVGGAKVGGAEVGWGSDGM